MIEHFGVPTPEIAKYVGITFASFSFCQFFTGIWWGRASDKFGRKPMIMLGLFGTLLSLLAFGFSTSVWMAVAARCFSGLLNGNVWNSKKHPTFTRSFMLMNWVILGWHFTNYGCRNGSTERGTSILGGYVSLGTGID